MLVLEERLLWGGAEGVLARMKEDPQLRKVPVLLLVGASQDDSEEPKIGRFCTPDNLAALRECIQRVAAELRNKQRNRKGDRLDRGHGIPKQLRLQTREVLSDVGSNTPNG